MDSLYINQISTIFPTEGICIHNGRNIVKKFVSPEGKTFIIKRFKKPTWFQTIGVLFRKTKAQRAFINAEHLLKKGFHTPKPLAYLQDDEGFSYLITEEDMGKPLCEAFQDQAVYKKFAKAFANYTYTLHRAGIIHKDYNATNIRFHMNENENRITFSLIDVNRMAFYTNVPPLRVRLKNLFLFSACDDSFKEVLKQYLMATGLYSNHLFKKTIIKKQRHDKWWKRKKSILSCIKFTAFS